MSAYECCPFCASNLVHFVAETGRGDCIRCGAESDEWNRRDLYGPALASLTAERDALKAQLDAIERDGTEEHNAAVELRSQLAEARAEVERLREALWPFGFAAKLMNAEGGWGDAASLVFSINARDLRAARAALSRNGEEG